MARLCTLAGVGPLLIVVAGLLACDTDPPPPSLAHALQVGGSSSTRAREYLRVALTGPQDDRRRAAFLWGLEACAAGSPRAAVHAFALAEPVDGAAALAARRLSAALGGSADADLWLAAAASGWVWPSDRFGFVLGAATAAARTGSVTRSRSILSTAQASGAEQRFHWLVASAQLGDADARTSRRYLDVEFPHRVGGVRASLASVPAPALSEVDRARQAEAWLAAEKPRQALSSSRQAGRLGPAIAARAALALRWPQTALSYLGRVRTDTAETWLARAEAHRQLGWNADGHARRDRFAQVLAAADRALRTSPAIGEEANARAYMAEAFVELGRYDDALPILRLTGVRDHPRWEWIRRRLLYLARGTPAGREAALEARQDGSRRVRRLAEFYLAVADHANGTTSGLVNLAGSGFPDLPALWAAGRLSLPVGIDLAAGPGPAQSPPGWADELLLLGRVSDVAVGWRAELERDPGGARGWIGLVELAEISGPVAIPLLVRGEPRLFAGPWSGLSRQLLEHYLLLPSRDSLETAARRADVPPWLMAGLVRQESAWNPTARSGAGAVGLAQLLPTTANELARRARLPKSYRTNLTDPEINLTLGGLLLQRWRQRLGGSWVAALAAYNAGERRIRDTIARTGHDAGPEFVEAIEIPETWDYVHRVVLLAEGYRLLYWPDSRGYPWT